MFQVCGLLLLATLCHCQNQQLPLKTTETSTWVPILKYSKEQGQDGSYKTNYATGNNIQASETGYLKDANEKNPNGVLVQEGSFAYETPDGELINVNYKADENGKFCC